MKNKFLIFIMFLGFQVFGSDSSFAGGGGVGSGGGGDYEALLKYARFLTENEPILSEILPIKDTRYYRYEFARAARSCLRKLRYLLLQGRRFKYADGAPVKFDEEMLRKFESRINDLEDSDNIHHFRLNPNLSVEETTKFSKKGDPLTAKNYPDGSIEFNPIRWEEIVARDLFRLGFAQREAVACHEIGSIDEVESTDEYALAAEILTGEFPPLPPKRCHSHLISTSWSFLNTGFEIVHKVGCESDNTKVLEFTLRKLFPSPAAGENNDGKKYDKVSASFSADIASNEFIRNPKMSSQLACAYNYLKWPIHLQVELDPKDRFKDENGKKIKEFVYSFPDSTDLQAFYGDIKIHETLLEAHKAMTIPARKNALQKADNALGEALLFLDELLQTKKTDPLFIKYSEQALVEERRTYGERLLKYYRDLTKWNKRQERLKRQKQQGFLGALKYEFMELKDVSKPHLPRIPPGDAFYDLRSCGYFNP